MSMCIARALDKEGRTAGYLWWGRLVSKPENATPYSSPSAARTAIKRSAHLATSWEVQPLERAP
jgi:hypothetical protein